MSRTSVYPTLVDEDGPRQGLFLHVLACASIFVLRSAENFDLSKIRKEKSFCFLVREFLFFGSSDSHFLSEPDKAAKACQNFDRFRVKIHRKPRFSG